MHSGFVFPMVDVRFFGRPRGPEDRVQLGAALRQKSGAMDSGTNEIFEREPGKISGDLCFVGLAMFGHRILNSCTRTSVGLIESSCIHF